MTLRPLLPAALLLLTLLAACTAPKPAPSPAPPPAPSIVAPPPSPPLPPPDWRDAPLSAGAWAWRRDERGSVALFGPVGEDAALAIRCDAGAHRVTLSRRDAAPPSNATVLTITTSFGTRALAAGVMAGSAPPYLGAALAGSDPLLDQIAFSRGRIMIAAAGLPKLIVPIWAEVGRVVEDCRD